MLKSIIKILVHVLECLNFVCVCAFVVGKNINNKVAKSRGKHSQAAEIYIYKAEGAKYSRQTPRRYTENRSPKPSYAAYSREPLSLFAISLLHFPIRYEFPRKTISHWTNFERATLFAKKHTPAIYPRYIDSCKKVVDKSTTWRTWMLWLSYRFFRVYSKFEKKKFIL